MVRRRIVLPVLVPLALLGLVGSPAAAVELQPFPSGDDQIRAFWELQDVSCGPSSPNANASGVHLENVPAGATYGYRLIVGGRVSGETSSGPPPALGTTTVAQGSVGFPLQPYPTTTGVLARIEVGGKATYIGGSLLTCASPTATPVVTNVEIFFPPCGVGGAPAFPDVPATNVFCSPVAWAADRWFVTGFADGSFRPTLPVSRQALAAMLNRTYNWFDPPSPPCAASPFSDVGAANVFCDDIMWMVGMDLVSGFSDGTFRPTTAVSRQSMAAILYRLAGSPRGEDPSCAAPPFSDVPASYLFCGEIAWLADTGIAGGFTDGTFRPTVPVSRQAMTTFLRQSLIVIDD